MMINSTRGVVLARSRSIGMDRLPNITRCTQVWGSENQIFARASPLIEVWYEMAVTSKSWQEVDIDEDDTDSMSIMPVP